MRHRKRTVKLGRTSAHRDALLAGLVCNLIACKRIQTTLPKAKAARSLAEKMVTLGKRGDLAARRRAIAKLHRPDLVRVLFENVAPSFKDRAGGYTRVIHLGPWRSDNAEMAILEWVNYIPQAPKVRKKKEKPGEKAAPGAAAKASPAKQAKAKAKEEKKAAAKKKTAKAD